MTANVTLVPEEFDVPLLPETERLCLRPLMASDVEKDFESVVSSEEHLRTVFRPGSNWPKGLSLEKNLADLKWHESEFENRTSFTYTVVAPAESKVLASCKSPVN